MCHGKPDGWTNTVHHTDTFSRELKSVTLYETEYDKTNPILGHKVNAMYAFQIPVNINNKNTTSLPQQCPCSFTLLCHIIYTHRHKILVTHFIPAKKAQLVCEYTGVCTYTHAHTSPHFSPHPSYSTVHPSSDLSRSSHKNSEEA